MIFAEVSPFFIIKLALVLVVLLTSILFFYAGFFFDPASIEKKTVENEIIEEKRLKEEEKINLKEEKRLDDEKKKKRLNGTVKWFNDAKGYGFIKREGKEKDIFVHFSAVKNSGLKYLKEGEQLTFEVEYSDKGLSAVNLQKTVNDVSRSHLKVVK